MAPKKQKLKTEKAVDSDKKDSSQRIESVIKTLESRSKTKTKTRPKSKTKNNKVKDNKTKDIIDKVLIVVMVAQLLFLIYYFLGY